MNRLTYYFEEILKKERLNTDGDNVESAIWNALVDQGLVGIVAGGAVVASTSTTKITVQPFIAVDFNGRRMHLDTPTDFDFSTDYTGASTTPSSGHFRWVSAVLRYGKLGSASVTDGDGATVYTVQTEGFSSTGDVTVDSGSANFEKIRFVMGTEASDSVSANRPSVPGPDIILCDLLLDDTGKVHLAPNGGISLSRVLVRSRIQGALAASNFNWDVTKYVFLDGWSFFDDGIVLRMYAHREQDSDPGLVFTVNAGWDGANKIWVPDASARPAFMLELTTQGLVLSTQNSGATSWTDPRHFSGGWDGRISILANVLNGDVTIDGNGVITGSGAQTAYAGLAFTSDGSSTWNAIAFPWPQQMAATPASFTLTALDGPDANASVGSISGNQWGGKLQIHPATANTPTSLFRKVVANP